MSYTTPHRKKFGSWLRKLRVKAGKTQWEVADAQGYDSAQFVSNWERGVSLPPLADLAFVAEMLKTTPREILKHMKECELASVETKYKEATASYLGR